MKYWRDRDVSFLTTSHGTRHDLESFLNANMYYLKGVGAPNFSEDEQFGEFYGPSTSGDLEDHLSVGQNIDSNHGSQEDQLYMRLQSDTPYYSQGQQLAKDQELDTPNEYGNQRLDTEQDVSMGPSDTRDHLCPTVTSTLMMLEHLHDQNHRLNEELHCHDVSQQQMLDSWEGSSSLSVSNHLLPPVVEKRGSSVINADFRGETDTPLSPFSLTGGPRLNNILNQVA